MRRGFFASFVFALFLPQFVFAGAADYQSPGSYTFTVPTYGSLTVQVWGAGGSGGGGGCAGSTAIGGAGGQSYFNGSVVGNGGGGGNAQVGAGGSASGGDTNLSGASGSGTSGGGSPNGGAGGTAHGTGGWPGGGGAGGCRGGGGGGYSSKTYSSGQLTVNSSISIVVGTGGAPSRTGSIVGYPANGASGRVYISWTTPAPTCSVWADTNPVAYSTPDTVHWTSANATDFTINYIGGETPNQAGQISLTLTSTTNLTGTVTGPGGSATCPYTLTVNPPATCSLPWGGTLSHGAGVTAYQAATVAYGSSCTAETRSCSNGSLSGSYQYQSCTVDSPPPTCALSASPSTISGGQSSTLSWSSAYASSCTGDNFSTASQTSGSTSVSPSNTTTYTASCTGPGGTTQCAGTGSGGTGALLSISCTESWTCTGAGNQTIHHVKTDCSPEDTVTCSSPQFCSTGSNICQDPTPIFNSGGDFTGHLQVRPSLVRQGDSTKLYWDVDNVLSCSVSGNSQTLPSATVGNAVVTNAINNQTSYTMTCQKLPDGSDSFSETIPVYVVPTMHEL